MRNQRVKSKEIWAEAESKIKSKLKNALITAAGLNHPLTETPWMGAGKNLLLVIFCWNLEDIHIRGSNTFTWHSLFRQRRIDLRLLHGHVRCIVLLGVPIPGTVDVEKMLNVFQFSLVRLGIKRPHHRYRRHAAGGKHDQCPRPDGLEHDGAEKRQPAVADRPADDPKRTSLDSHFQREDLRLVDPRNAKLVICVSQSQKHFRLLRPGSRRGGGGRTQDAPKTKVKIKMHAVAPLPYPLPYPFSERYDSAPAAAIANAWSTAPIYSILRLPYLSRQNTGMRVLRQ